MRFLERKKEFSMLTQEEWMDVHLLSKQGHSIRAISQQTGFARNTVRRMLRQGTAPQPARRSRPSGLDPFKTYLEERYQQYQLSAVRLFQEICAQGYAGSEVMVRRYVKTLKPDKAFHSRLTVRFETPPGEQAQADWAYCGKFVDGGGRSVSIYAFVMVLGYSRLRYVEFTPSMRMEHLLRCLMNAFAFFQGVPQVVLFDNMKQVRLNANTWNPQMLDFAGHYGFTPKTHAPYRPRSKGKVERLVRFVKDNFLNGKSFNNGDDLNAQCRMWLDQVNARVHGTTGRIPLEVWQEEERSCLFSLNAVAPYQLCRQATRLVDWEGMVRFERSRYSVPPRHAGQRVTVELRGQQITVRCGDVIIASHEAAMRADSHVVQAEHLEALWKTTLKRMGKQPVPLPRWQMSFSHEVASVDLKQYQQWAEDTVGKSTFKEGP
jgi:transposase